ncbi:NAD-dependent epimerase/dehydratase family protein [Xylanibacillus composti]|uniref:Epimerase n=1 Tax=Xylanibacillus composti TaxID=1572762 RepID=A0A8J4H6S1_9BACL|nr:NAD-dependent epimerase/dehydratase family protein [Xylanibacillus composti]MDT9724510.1 NAD-dependent epimerase/dehydratase family protein [Xylanibacillus composti]GIQ69773.1 epimerase [Xylanibacillus composti]
MKFLVTGGAGFIGSHLVDALLNDQHNVIAIDNFDPFYPRSIKESNIAGHLQSPNFQFIEADIRSRDIIFEIFKEKSPEVVIHLAAKAGVRPSLQDPQAYIEVNINGTANVLDASVASGVQKFIFASSSSVYGLNDKVPFSEEDPILRSASPYGATKAAGEAICTSYNNCYGLPIVALRFFTVYGPRQRPDLAIHKFAKNMLQREVIPIFGDGSTCRDYTYISDIVKGIKAAIHYQTSGYEVFNLGNDRPVRLIDLVQLLESALRCEARWQRLPEQMGDVPQTWADITRSRKLLGYEPEIEIHEGLEQFADWLKNGELHIMR